MGTHNGPIRTTLPRRSVRTVLIIRNAYEWQYGGAEQFCFNLARSLRAEGIRPVVVSKVPDLLEHCHEEHIETFANLWFKNETHRRWAPVYYLLSPVLVGQYVYLMLRYRPQVVLLGSRDDQIFGTIAAVLMRKATVWIDHGDMKGIVSQPFRFLNKGYYWALDRARRVIAVSAAEREKVFAHLAKRYQDKFTVINNGATLKQVAARPRPSGSKVISFVGRIERDKGIYDLMEAIPTILKQHPEAVVWLAGKGLAEDDVRNIVAERGWEQQVKLLGHLGFVGEALFASDVFVYPTHHEASGIAPVEAMQAGVPVVVTRVGGVPEVVPETAGLLVPAHNPVALAAAINRLLEDSELYERLKAGAIKRGQELEFDRVVRERYIPVLEAVVR